MVKDVRGEDPIHSLTKLCTSPFYFSHAGMFYILPSFTMNNETLVAVGGRRKFAPSDIILLESDVNYTRLYLSDGSMFLSSTNIGQLERRFASYAFFRINRTYLVNLRFIEERQNASLRMSNQMEMHISRRRTNRFYRFLRKTLARKPL